MKTIKLGLVKGRHEMPVDEYILEEVSDPTNYKAIHAAVYNKLDQIVSQDDFVSLYVTGLTIVSIECVQYFVEHSIEYQSMHFDVKTGTYFSQPGLTRI
ncbi:hypothetical protein [Lactobacillus taiwanensis]|uniref:hypothetical protein n=1 Tax=Lactobacillus taiwanensis TaxID=508451 RepID=UPI00321F93A2